MYDLVCIHRNETENLLFQLVACLFTGNKTKDMSRGGELIKGKSKAEANLGPLGVSVTPTKNC